MAYFAITDFAGDSTGFENSLAYKIAAQKTAYTAALAAIAAQRTRLDAIADTTGIAAKLRGAVETQALSLAILENESVRQEMMTLNAVMMDDSFAPRDGSGVLYGSTFDAWFASRKSGLTNPLLTNEFARVYRRLATQAALSAANCSGLTATSYGTTTVSATGVCTNVLVAAPIDTTLYGGCLLEGEVTTELSGAITFTLTGTDLNGSAQTMTCTVGAGDIHAGDKTIVIPGTAKTYLVKITGVAANTGSAGVIRWQARDPRTLAA